MAKFYYSIGGNIQKILILSMGSVPGALIRWHWNDDFTVNIIGAGILGFTTSLPIKPSLRLLFGAGFCGSLTTYSGWMIKLAKLLLNGSIFKAFQLLTFTLFFGFLFGAIGFLLGSQIRRIKRFL